MRVTGKRSKVAFGAMVLAISLLATLAIMPLKYSAAQNATNTGPIREILAGKVEQMKSQHPELASLADKLQNMNVTQISDEVASMLDLAKDVVTGLKNIAGNSTVAK